MGKTNDDDDSKQMKREDIFKSTNNGGIFVDIKAKNSFELFYQKHQQFYLQLNK